MLTNSSTCLRNLQEPVSFYFILCRLYSCFYYTLTTDSEMAFICTHVFCLLEMTAWFDIQRIEIRDDLKMEIIYRVIAQDLSICKSVDGSHYQNACEFISYCLHESAYDWLISLHLLEMKRVFTPQVDLPLIIMWGGDNLLNGDLDRISSPPEFLG